MGIEHPHKPVNEALQLENFPTLDKAINGTKSTS